MSKMLVAVGPYRQSQPSCFDHMKMGFVMGCAVGMAAGALFRTFSCLRIRMRGQELVGGIGKTMTQSGGTFGTFMAIGMGIEANHGSGCSLHFLLNPSPYDIIKQIL
ncbi:reactive oxygen species modulator 1-like [Nycticebus coucang]|uniref:reactive oxygen species modulator 1-like n=1 Tax=Nycticebus coucang TaxID=9470 RepID=UPI00234CB37B|nr:reactive oxygen species modulator 1-like [Nycticebus coucang]